MAPVSQLCTQLTAESERLIVASNARNRSRRQQTQIELVRLHNAFDRWLEYQRSLDRNDEDKYVGRHKTQLEAIESLLKGALQPLQKHVDDSDDGKASDAFYSEFRAYDEAIVGLERLWQFFRDKLDQRDPARRESAVLRAADEVVWSCYRDIFKRPLKGVRQGPPPLSYIAPEYSPAALQSDRPPSGLMLGADLDFLEGFLKTLPVPLLRLPPWAVDAPWWLIYVAHEVGHHVQKDLVLIAWFAAGIRAAAARAGTLEAPELDKWSKWGEEIFADLFSIMMMGPWAIFGVLEAEWSPTELMVKRKREYPSPVIRLALMQRTAQLLSNALEETWFDPLQGIDLKAIADKDPVARRDWQAVEPICHFCVGPLRDDFGTLQRICGLRPGVFSQTGAVWEWSRVIRKPEAILTKHELETARHLAGATLQTWAAVTANGPIDDRDRSALARRATDFLVKSAEPGTRGALMPAGAMPEMGANLLDRLLRNADESQDHAKVTES
jgi:hypothetical protein